MRRLNLFRRLQRARRPNAGFTVIELIVVLAILAIASFMLLPKLFWFVDRARLRGAAVATKAMIQTARLAAMKGQGGTRVVFNFTKGEVFAYVDTDGDQVFNRNNDRLLGDYFILDKSKKVNVQFMSAGDAGPKAAGAVETWDDPDPDPTRTCESNACIVFDGSGSTRAGAVSFTDGYWNFIEVRILSPATGRTELRKFHRTKGIYIPDTLHTEAGSRTVSWEWYEDHDPRVPFS